VLLSDFGIAVVSSSSISPDTKEVAGTIAYMAPEQIMGKPRPASDQYALGVVVYEWLCGELPFSGTFLETCTQHLYAPPPSLREKNPALSPALEKVVCKALAKEPEQRFASIQDFADALEECVRPSAPHYYSTIRLPYASLFAPSAPSSLNRAAIKGILSTRPRLLWLYIIGICLLISTLTVFAPVLLQRLSTRTPSLLSLSAHTYQPPTIRSQVATQAPSRTHHRVQATVLPTSSPTLHPTPGITPTSTPSSAHAKATPGSLSNRPIVPSPVPTTAPPVAPSPTPGSSLQLQVTPASLAPQACSERPGYWECNVTITASGSNSGRLRWSMALSGGIGNNTTTILHGRLMAGESRPIMIYIPNDPFANSCTSTSLIFTSSANMVTVPWTCP
jgi:serine/threonine protein kinase